MDMSFANQALSAEYIAKNYSNMENQVYTVPEQIDASIASLKLKALGIEIDQAALKKFKVNYSYIDVARHIYRYARASGETIYIACHRTALHGRYTEAGLPICEQGSQIEIISDDGSKKFANFYEEVTKQTILFRRETAQKKK